MSSLTAPAINLKRPPNQTNLSFIWRGWRFDKSSMGMSPERSCEARSLDVPWPSEARDALSTSLRAGIRPLTRVVTYSAAKGVLINFTQWLAVHMAQEYSSSIRVNAIAPGFFLTEQNRYLLLDSQSGAWTARGSTIVQHTPMGCLGEPEDLIGTVIWLASPASAFVRGAVIPVDGGFASFSGV